MPVYVTSEKGKIKISDIGINYTINPNPININFDVKPGMKALEVK